MCLMLSVINCSRKCPTVKKTEKKKAVRNVYLFSFFMTLPSLHFPFSEGGSIYCILSVECVYCSNTGRFQ